MTEERKQELTQLLQEAMENLEIRCESAGGISYLTVSEYRNRLLQQWDYSGLPVTNFTPHIVREVTKSKLLDFIREELSKYILEDWIQSACIFAGSSRSILGYLKCIRLFRPQFRKVKTSFVVEIREVSNILTPNVGVSDYRRV